MIVTGYATDNDTDWTKPYPPGRFGVVLRLLRGDTMSPDLSDATLRPGQTVINWFNAVPKRIFRDVVGYRPFISIGIGCWGVYMGWKVYGVDSTAYLDYPGVSKDDVYDGSQAMVGTLRFTMSRKYGT
jgi:hypothetical protein